MHEATQRRSIIQLRELQTEQAWRRESELPQDDSILTDMTKVVLNVTRSSMFESKAGLDTMRTQIESAIAPPALPRARLAAA